MATQASLDFVQHMYVAYYGRPADPAGLQYWADRAENEGQGAILDAFGTSQEFTDQYGDMGNAQLVDNLYQQLFGRSADASGQQYYTSVLAAGDKSLSEIAVTIMNAAQGSDAEVIDNKVEVANYYTDNVAQEGYDNSAAKSALAEIDAQTDDQEIATLKDELDASMNGGDGSTGDTGGDTGTPPAGGGGSGDGSDGGTDTGDTTIRDVTTADQTTYSLQANESIRFSGVSQAETINVTNLGANQRVILENSDLTLNLDTGAATAGNLELTDSTLNVSGLQDDATLTALDVTASGDSTLNMEGSLANPLTSLTLSGDGSLNLQGATIGDTATQGAAVDASGYTGSLTVSDDQVLDAASSVTTGSGDDSIVMNDISDQDGRTVTALDGGDGNDTLTVTGAMTADSGAVATDVSGFETVNFQNYVDLDATDIQGASELHLVSGAKVFNLQDGQSVVADANYNAEKGSSSPLQLVDAGDAISVTANDPNDVGQALELKILDDTTEGLHEGGSLDLGGNADVIYEESGRKLATFDASDMTGNLDFTGGWYVQEDVLLGEGNDTVAVAYDDTDDQGAAIVSATSTVDNLDIIQNFGDSGNDTLVDEDNLTISWTDQTDLLNNPADLQAAFDTVVDASANGEYVSFTYDGATFLYADTDLSGTANGDDFALQLGVTDSANADAMMG